MTSPKLGNPTKGLLTWKTEWTVSCSQYDCPNSSTLICHTKHVASASLVEMGWIQLVGDVWICPQEDESHKNFKGKWQMTGKTKGRDPVPPLREINYHYELIRIQRSLFQQQHPDALGTTRRLQPGEIDTGGETGGVPGDAVLARLLGSLKQSHHLLADDVVNLQCDIG